MLFICLTAIGYLYVDSRNQFMKQITEIREENRTLKNENRMLNDTIFKMFKKETLK
jgi:hypothetical protein